MSELEKTRYERLKLVARTALEQVLRRSLTQEHIKSYFPELSQSQQSFDTLVSAVSQMESFWLKTCLDEFDLIYKEREVESRLIELDQVIEDAESRRIDDNETPDFVDELTPLEIIDSNIIHKSEDILSSLRLIQEQLNLENVELYQELKSLSDQSNNKKASIIQSLEQLQKEVSIIDSTSNDGVDKLIDLLH